MIDTFTEFREGVWSAALPQLSCALPGAACDTSESRWQGVGRRSVVIRSTGGQDRISSGILSLVDQPDMESPLKLLRPRNQNSLKDTE